MLYWTVIRVISVVIMLILIATFGTRYVRNMRLGLREMSLQGSHLVLFQLGLVFLFGSLVFGIIDLMNKGVPGGIRNLFQVISLVWILVATHWEFTLRVVRWVNRHLHRKPPENTST